MAMEGATAGSSSSVSPRAGQGIGAAHSAAPGRTASPPLTPNVAPVAKNTAGQASSGARAAPTPKKGFPSPEAASLGGIDPRRVGVFFSIYFFMTGLHALHVLAGMAAIGWILSRAARGDFNSRYFGPVDYVGLYWHLVDMIWIYLFPLLYLIH
jgi:cytochrome c oxidase subunit 3